MPSAPTPPSSPEETIFIHALGLPTQERATYLDQTCVGDPTLRRRIEELLRAEDSAAFMAAPAAGVATTARPAPRPAEAPGDLVGRYKLLQKIGEGGCGVVYMAEQQEPVVRRVALKVIKLGMDTREVVARFEAERQALALMDHPNIARVLDGGATDGGRPFFVMELVRGVPITKYCDEQNLATAARLELFTQVCHAVQHAHQKGIIHRDLKPSNILVTVNDGRPVPKVIDFGIAKATQGKLTDATLFTAFEQFIGTPAYMSPEQAVMTSLDVDTRSDIYSLGVLLYELLAGRPPFDPKTLVQAGLDEIRRVIREVDPPRPSTRLSTLTDLDRATIAKQRAIEPAQLSLLLRGDLDWIVMRCLEKDRNRRYETANALALDLLRHLHDEPVAARPPSAAYRVKKLVRRHQLAFAAGGAVAVALVGGIIVSTWEAVRATRAEDMAHRQAERANNEAAVSRAVNEFLRNDLLNQASPRNEVDRDIKLRTVLDRAASKVHDRFATQPAVERAVTVTLADTYHSLGENAVSEKLQQRVIDLSRQIDGPVHRTTLYNMNRLALWYSVHGKLLEATTLYRQTLELRKKALGPDDTDTLDSMARLGDMLAAQDHLAEAEALFQQCLETERRARPPNPAGIARATWRLARISSNRDRVPEAMAMFEQAIALQRSVGAEGEHNLALMLRGLSALHKRQGRWAEAESTLQSAIDLQRHEYGSENHPDILWTINELAWLYADEDKLAEAEKLAADVLEKRKTLLGPAHPETLDSMDGLADFYTRRGKMAEATALQEERLALATRAHGRGDLTAIEAANSLSGLYQWQGRAPEATALVLQTLDLRKKVLGSEHPTTLATMAQLADLYREQHKFNESVALHLQTLEIRRRVLGENDRDTLTSWSNLASVYRDMGRAVEAEKIHRDVVERRRRVLGPDTPEVVAALDSLAQDYRAQNKQREAIAVQQQILDIHRRTRGKDSNPVLDELWSLGLALEAAGDFAEAEACFREQLAGEQNRQSSDTKISGPQAMLGRVLVRQKKFAEAEPLLRAALKVREEKMRGDSRVEFTRSTLGAALTGLEKFAEAESNLVASADALERMFREKKLARSEYPRVTEAFEWAGQFFAASNQPEKAAAWRTRATAVKTAVTAASDAK